MTVPSQAGNLSDFLKSGGVSSVPAEQAANQIGNAFRQQLSRGPVQVDYTPEAMRLITPQARKYLFTNLDWEDNPAYRNSKRSRKRPEQEQQLVDPRRHPLQGSQPVTVTQAINEQQVFPGPYTDVLSQRRNGFAVYTIGLRLGAQKGTHARFNESTKVVEGVPIEWDIDQNQFLRGYVKETPDATKLTLSLQNLQAMEIPVFSGGWKMQPIAGWHTGASYSAGIEQAQSALISQGTWTPQLRSVGTFTNGSWVNQFNPVVTYGNLNSGTWVKIGPMVFIQFRLFVSNVTSKGSGRMVVGPLPFRAINSQAGYWGGRLFFSSGGYLGASAPRDFYVEAGGRDTTANHGQGPFDFFSIVYPQNFGNQNHGVSFITDADLPGPGVALDMIGSCVYLTQD